MAEIVSFLLRVPRDLLDEIRQWAKDDDRSVSGQIVHLLRRAVEERRASA